MRRLASTALVLFAVLGAYAGEPEAPALPRRLLVLGAGGRPLAGAFLLAAQPPVEGLFVFDPGSPVLLRSDAAGQVDMRAASEAGPRTWIAWGPGLAPALVPPGPGAAIVRLAPAVATGGSVRLPRGTAAARMEMLALPAGGPGDLAHRAQTDEAGRFLFASLPRGRWRLFLRRDKDRLQGLGPVDAGATDIERSVRGETSFRGFLLDGDGTHDAAAAGVSLRFAPMPGGGADHTTPLDVVTGEDGAFFADGLAPGVYAVELPDRAWTFDQEPPRLEAEEGRARQFAGWFALRRRGVVGRVVDPDKRPLAGARIQIVRDPSRAPPPGGYGPPADAVRSDAQGHFRLRGVTPAEGYRLVVVAAGYAPWISNGFGVDRGRDTELEAVRLRPGWRLEVRVRDARGRPVPGARVTVTAASRPAPTDEAPWRELAREGTTDPDGRLALEDLPGEDVLCVAGAEGYLAASVEVPYPRASGHRRVDLDLTAAAELTGQVLVEEGGAVRLFRVSARTRDGRSVEEVRTTEDGAFRFAALRDTATDVDVLPADAADPMILARVENVMPGAQPHLEIPVPRTHALAGRVAGLEPDASGAVVVEALRYDASAERHAWVAVRRARLAAGVREAAFRVEGLPPGGYTVRAVQGALDSDALAVQVEEGDLEGLELLLPSGARIAGTVLDAEGLPRLGTAVHLLRMHGEDVAMLDRDGPLHRATNARGEFFFAGVAPGLWRVVAHSEHAAPDAADVRVLEGEVRVVRDLILSEGGTLEGEVEDALGRAMDGARVWIRRFDGSEEPRWGRTDGEGRFRFRHLRPGAYHVRVGAGRRTAGPSVEGVVQVDAGSTARILFTAGEEGVVEGRVGRGGRPVAGAVVDLVHEPDAAGAPLRRFRTETDAAGVFRIEQLPPGAYRLQMQSGAWRTEEALVLGEGEELNLDLEAWDGRLRGDVLTRDGVPVSGARVLAHPLAEDGRAHLDSPFVAEGRTDPRGAFDLRGIPVGAYTLTVSADGLPPGRLARAEAELPGADFRVEVVLGRGGDLALHVLDDSERGVTGARIWIEDNAGFALHARAYVTGAGGRLRIQGLPAGRARVRVQARGMGRPARPAVTIVEGHETPLVIHLGPAGRLDLVVAGTGGDPVALVRVDVLRARTGEVVARHRRLTPVREPSPWDYLPPSGAVRIGDLEAGAYVARITAGRRYADVDLPFTIHAGGVTVVEATLARGGGGR